MDMQTYQELALRTAPGGPPRNSRTVALALTGDQKQWLLGALGLCGEAGELAEVIKKHVFHEHPMDAETRSKLRKECGDCLWYLNYIAALLDRDLGEIADLNIEKLMARYPEGTFSAERSMCRAVGDV